MTRSFALLFGVTLAIACHAQTGPSLNRTIDYMASILATGGDGHQKILFGGDYRKDRCRLFISDTITDAVVKPEKVYDTEVQFPLGRIDPKSVKVNIHDQPVAQVEFETTDYESVIWESASKWKETRGRMPKTLELSAFPSYHFNFLNSKYAGHFANAFRHAVDLCGGKPSIF